MGDGRRGSKLASGGSLTAHGAILLGLLGASHLRVEPIEPPRIPVVMVTPPAASGTPGTSSPPPPAAGSTAPATHPRSNVEVVPEGVAPLHPAVPPADVTAESVGVPGAVSGDGAQDGVPGGIPGGIGSGAGSAWGFPGGTGTGGPPGSVLAGLPRDGEAIYLTTDVTPPEKIVDVRPVYPETARLSRTSGTVVLQIVVGPDGRVEQATVVSSAALFDDAALAAVRQWRYKPAIRAGRAVRVFQTVRVVFAIG